ncbi:peptidase E [Clostridium sp.]|uniref:peptidase E n=1 Tax=Clostridium sp. TaxID=1506 RepID=UPI003D6D6F26
MGKIITIGGGNLGQLQTFEIDKHIVKSTNKEKPKALFIPTAGNDATTYIETFNKVYGEMLGCHTDALCLINSNITEDEIKEKIFSSDIIYVGEGDTKSMLKIWKENKVDYYLKQAYKGETILCGLSAGSICWFDYGYSDVSSEGDECKNFIKLKALGLLKGFHCPHFNEGSRGEGFINMLKHNDILGIGIDNNCALEVLDDKFRILKSDKNAKAYKIFNKNKVVITEELTNIESYEPLENFYKTI